MSIKFNCSNPDCHQRLEVEGVMAGQSMLCPACSLPLRVPAAQDVKFHCSNPSCGQHLVADVLEAGRFLRCPACGKPMQIPGALQHTPLGARPAAAQRLTERRPDLVKRRPLIVQLLLTPAGRLLSGWGLGLAVVVVLLTAFKTASQTGLPPHLIQMSDEIYDHGIGDFREIPPQIIGNSLFFLQYVGEDVQVLRLDLRTLVAKRIAVIRTVSSDMGFVWLGFLPDARHFAYCARGENKYGQSFFLGNTNNEAPRRFILKSKAKESPSKVTGGFWLSYESAILKREDGGVYILNMATDPLLGRLGAKGLVRLFSLPDASQSATYASSHAISYLANGSVWNYDLLDGRASVVVALGQRAFSDLNGNRRNQKWLVTRQDPADPEDSDLYEYNPDNRALNLVRQHACGAQWMEDGQGCAFFELADGKRTLDVREPDGTVLTNLFGDEGGQLRSFALGDGGSVYGIVEDERGATRISRFEAARQDDSTLYQIQGGYRYAKTTPAVETSTTNRAGERVEYYYLPPVDFNPAKKYPVLLDMTSSSRHDHGRDLDFIANCGIFFVSPNRLGILKFGITPTEADTMAVYDELLKNPSVDPRRIYIVGESITTGMASLLVAGHPEMWRGLILIEPVSYPMFPSGASAFPSVLMSIGDSDQYNVTSHNYGRAENFLNAAGAHLVSARIYYQPNTAHAFKPEQLKATYQTVARFILNNS